MDIEDIIEFYCLDDLMDAPDDRLRVEFMTINKADMKRLMLEMMDRSS